MEVNRRWKQEYDLLKTKYLREKSEYEEENHSLKMEVSRLRDELTRLAYAVNEGSHAKADCCNGRSDQARQGNGNVDQLIKEQVQTLVWGRGICRKREHPAFLNILTPYMYHIVT